MTASIPSPLLCWGSIPWPRRGPKPTPIRERFYLHVRKSEGDGCWLWTGRVDSLGYGEIKVSGRKMKAHRVAYEMEVGPLPPGHFACHRCDTPGCVRAEKDPLRSHIFAGTPADNVRDMETKGRGAIRAGENNGRAIRSQEQIDEMRRAYLAGEPPASIARRLGLRRTYVGKVVRGELWRVGGPPAPGAAANRGQP